MGSVNLYAYCRNNPVNLVDPSGFGPGYGGSGYGDGGDGFGEGGGSGGSGGVLGGDGGPGDDAMDLAREVEQTEHLVADLGDALASTAAVVLPAVDMAAGAADEAAEAAAEAGPNFIGQESGPSIAVPEGATGPYPTRGNGFQYTGGSGGNGLDSSVSNVRVMDPTAPRGPSPGYPNGYVSYSNGSGQAVNPVTGATLNPKDPWWHFPLGRR